MFSGMNIHLPAIFMFTRYQGFDPLPYNYDIYDIHVVLRPLHFIFYFEGPHHWTMPHPSWHHTTYVAPLCWPNAHFWGHPVLPWLIGEGNASLPPLLLLLLLFAYIVYPSKPSSFWFEGHGKSMKKHYYTSYSHSFVNAYKHVLGSALKGSLWSNESTAGQLASLYALLGK